MSSSAEKMAYIQKLRGQVEYMSTQVTSAEKNLQEKEMLIRQGQLPNRSARDVERNMVRNLGPELAPGNLGDVNKVIWPYYFTTEISDTPLAPNETLQTGISVTYEAAFIAMAVSKVVYDASAADWVYLNPNDEQNNINSAPGLSFTLRDGSSSRQFFDKPINLSNVGNPRFPTKLPRPVMFLPNQNIQVAFQNSHASNIYAPNITLFGYRIRIEDAQNLLGLAYA